MFKYVIALMKNLKGQFTGRQTHELGPDSSQIRGHSKPPSVIIPLAIAALLFLVFVVWIAREMITRQ